jgi:anthranilate synthase component 1
MQVSPSLAAVEAYNGPEQFVALSISLLADTETPISLFRKLSAGRPDVFLLESVEGGELMGRYSFIGCGRMRRFEFRDGVGTISDRAGTRTVTFSDPLDVLREALKDWTVWNPQDLPRFHGGAVGYLGFDCMKYFEPSVPLPPSDGTGLPEGVMLLTDELVIYDHVLRRLLLVVHAPLTGDRAEGRRAGVERLEAIIGRLVTTRLAPEAPWLLDPKAPEVTPVAYEANRDPANMMAAVSEARAAITAGEVFQVVVSQRLTVEATVDPLTLYRALRAVNPSPYMFLLRFDDFAVVGASPEVLVRLEDEQLLVRPIAGTRPRGATPEQDEALAAELLADEKELAEHRMLVDLGRNDVGRCAQIGTVTVHDREHIERYSHVMHIVTDVHGTLRPGMDAFDVFRACFPAGTVSGAPKVRACELLAKLEPERRGLYAGAVGYFGTNGSMDTCIAIRTLLVQPDRVHVQAGAGIVHDSVPEHEHVECINKARAGLKAVGLAMARGVGA